MRLTPQQLQLQAALAAEPAGLDLTQIAERLGLATPQQALAVASGLTRLGLAVVVPGPTGDRVVLLRRD